MLRLPLVQPRLLALCARMGLDFVVRAPSSVVHPRRGLRFCRRTIRRCGRARDVREGIDLRTPDLSGLLFLAFLLILLPWGAWRTARRLRGEEPGPPVSRITYWRSAVFTQAFLLTLAWLTGSGFGYRVFDPTRLGWEDVPPTVVALAVCFGIRLASLRARSERELRELEVYRRAPRNLPEQAWFFAAVVLASVAEEGAYRGVGWAILWYAIGSPWLPALILSVAFALVHWNQGWKSGVAIFCFAAVLHGLVALTNSLLPAMAVHATYDFAAGEQIRRKARAMDLAAGAPAR